MRWNEMTSKPNGLKMFEKICFGNVVELPTETKSKSFGNQEKWKLNWMLNYIDINKLHLKDYAV